MRGFDYKVKVDVKFRGGLHLPEFGAIGRALLHDEPLYIESTSDNVQVFSGVCFPRAVVPTLDGWLVEVEPKSKKRESF